jgi:hypothetical protein
MSMILYIPQIMHSSQLTHIFNKEVSLRSLQIKIFNHEMTHTRLEARKVCMNKILVTEISLEGCSR